MRYSFAIKTEILCGTTQEIFWKKVANYLARDLMKNMRSPFAKSILVASFVEIDDFSRSSFLGRMLAELLAEELHRLGFTVYEPRLTRDFLLEKEGEFILSRKSQNLYREIGAQAAVTGLIGRKENYLVVQVRMISLADSRILSIGSIEIIGLDEETSPSVLDSLP